MAEFSFLQLYRTMHHKHLNSARERREKAAATAYATIGVVNQVLSSQDNEINRNIEGAVLDLRNEGRPEYSSMALKPKKKRKRMAAVL